MEGELDPLELEARLKDVRARAYKLAKKRVSADEAEDVAQHVVEAIRKRISHLPRLLAKEGELAAYVTTAVKNKCQDLRKKKKAEENRLVRGGDLLYSRSSALDPENFLYRDDRNFFERHASELPPREQEVIFYLFEAGFRGVHAAELMGITPQSVNTHKNRGLAKLKKVALRKRRPEPPPKWEKLRAPEPRPWVQAELSLVMGLPAGARAVVTRRPRDRGIGVVLFDVETVTAADLSIGFKGAVDVFAKHGRDVPQPLSIPVTSADPPLDSSIDWERTLEALRKWLSFRDARKKRTVDGFGTVSVVFAEIPA